MAGRFILNILGSASAKPNLKRESSAQLLQAAERLFLIDCSEGTQVRILRQNELLSRWARENNLQGVRRISKNNLDAIFLSHAHGDHMFGLFPLLNTMGMNNRSKPLLVFGPENFSPILNFYRSFWGVKDSFELKFIPLKMKFPETVYEIPGFEIKAFPLNHGIDSFGFLFRETGQCTFRKEPCSPRSYAYCSDTAPFPELQEWVKGVDVLYHEATYMVNDAAKARARFHSTTADAAGCASGAGVSRLLVGHYSSSIREDMVHGVYEAELKSFFKESKAVDDGDIFDFPLQML